MKAMNKLEEKALEMLREGKTVTGPLREILIDMALREEEEEKK